MIIDGHRVIELPSSPRGAREGSPGRTGRRRLAAFAAALAALLWGAAPAAAQPEFVELENPLTLIPDVLYSIHPAFHTEYFKNAGTNPRFTEATFSPEEYFDAGLVNAGRLFFRIETSEDLRALAEPPTTNPLEATMKVTLENDEGETATGTIPVEAEWDAGKADDDPPPDAASSN